MHCDATWPKRLSAADSYGRRWKSPDSIFGGVPYFRARYPAPKLACLQDGRHRSDHPQIYQVFLLGAARTDTPHPTFLFPSATAVQKSLGITVLVPVKEVSGTIGDMIRRTVRPLLDAPVIHRVVASMQHLRMGLQCSLFRRVLRSRSGPISPRSLEAAGERRSLARTPRYRW
jgi:hypothetical protein